MDVSGTAGNRASVAVVTGGARGIGAATAELLDSRGYVVSTFDVDFSNCILSERVERRTVDTSNPADVDKAFAEIERNLGNIDITVCNAGIGGGAPVADLTDELFQQLLQVNLFGVFVTARAAVRRMIPRRKGSIVTIGSVFGQNPPGGTSAYAASKAGVAAFSRSLALEVAQHGIRVNCISPGHIMTELYERALERRAGLRGISIEQVTSEEEAAVPLGRFGTPDDIANVIGFLVSDAGAYVTGQRLNVDGGLEPF
jgi:2,3-dihydro-2,3-dihydroxybenzoate dehydrogenase